MACSSLHGRIWNLQYFLTVDSWISSLGMDELQLDMKQLQQKGKEWLSVGAGVGNEFPL
ncbi:hypothetical protein C5167_019954 [Papaver somniferum]|uniref:Uncharacterized protein n=1 Tax=Papaver somniferum TaxID=3469 RepID=A0A4Y7IRL6_PAPSO|nr:hypothetical protein C5167_019954 [Papaver somniferum]